MQKRDIVSEILERQHRSADGDVRHYTNRIATLSVTIRSVSEKLGYSKSEWLKYVPIAICASIEGYVRTIIARMIDFGEPYSENAKALSEAIKHRFDLGLVLAIQQEKITAGDFISHLVPISSCSDICNHMSAILGADFISMLKPHYGNYKYYLGNERPIIDIELTSESSRKDVIETFRLRHIFCHESAATTDIDDSQASRLVDSADQFLSAIGSLVGSLLDPLHEIHTTLNYNDYLRELLTKREMVMQQVYDALAEVEKLQLPDGSSFQDVQDKWRAFCDAQASFRYEQFIDGSIRNELCLCERIALTDSRINDLRRLYFDWAIGERGHSLFRPARFRKKGSVDIE